MVRVGFIFVFIYFIEGIMNFNWIKILKRFRCIEICRLILVRVGYIFVYIIFVCFVVIFYRIKIKEIVYFIFICGIVYIGI